MGLAGVPPPAGGGPMYSGITLAQPRTPRGQAALASFSADVRCGSEGAE